MFKILRNIIALFALLSLTIGGAVLVGRAQPIPARVAQLHLGDRCALPCWIGITPGKTTRSDAERLISDMYNHGQPLIGPQDGTWSLHTADGRVLKVDLFVPTEPKNNDIVHGINLGGDAVETLPLGDVITALGAPEYVTLVEESVCAQLVKAWAFFDENCDILWRGYAPRFQRPIIGGMSLFVAENTAPPHYVRWHGPGIYFLLTPPSG